LPSELDQLPGLVKGRLQFLMDEKSAMESATTKDSQLLAQVRELKTGFQPNEIETSGIIDSVRLGSFRSRALDDPIGSSSSIQVSLQCTCVLRFSVQQKSCLLRVASTLLWTAGMRVSRLTRIFISGKLAKYRRKLTDQVHMDWWTWSYTSDFSQGWGIYCEIQFWRATRIEKILDSVNGNLVESQGILTKINSTIGRILGLVDRHSLLVKIGLVIAGAMIVFTLALIPILLLRMIIFASSLLNSILPFLQESLRNSFR